MERHWSDGLPDIRFLQRESWEDRDYFWDNRLRLEHQGVIVQQTLRGSAFFEMDGKRLWVEEGRTMVFFKPEDSRYGLDDRCALPYRLRWLHLHGGPEFLDQFRRLRAEFGAVLRMDPRGEASGIVDHLEAAARAGRPRDRLYLAEAAYRLLLALCREQIDARRGDDPVSYGRHLLETGFRSPRNLKEWSEELGLSREHFTREFHRRYHETPAAFLRRLRLEHARMLLRNPGLSQADVAASSGFSSPQTFRRAYRNHYGIPAGAGEGEPRK